MEGQFSFVVSKNFQSAQFQYAQYVHRSRLSRTKYRPAARTAAPAVYIRYEIQEQGINNDERKFNVLVS